MDTVADGKAKKRIQNRVAQRSYRVFFATASCSLVLLISSIRSAYEGPGGGVAG